jgi:hypothetical protein
MEISQMTLTNRKRATLVASVAGCLALTGTALAQTQPSTAAQYQAQPPTAAQQGTSNAAQPATPNQSTTAMQMPSATPSKSETAVSAFAKLDIAHRGYVTKQETAKLEGFDKAFDQADKNKDGKLTQSEFEVAWGMYSGNRGG